MEVEGEGEGEVEGGGEGGGEEVLHIVNYYQFKI